MFTSSSPFQSEIMIAERFCSTVKNFAGREAA